MIVPAPTSAPFVAAVVTPIVAAVVTPIVPVVPAVRRPVMHIAADKIARVKAIAGADIARRFGIAAMATFSVAVSWFTGLIRLAGLIRLVRFIRLVGLFRRLLAFVTWFARAPFRAMTCRSVSACISPIV